MPLNNLFPTLQFDDLTHQYFDGGGGCYRSVTTWLNQFAPFDVIAVSNRQAKLRGVTQDVILLEWQAKADLGTEIHNIVEIGLQTFYENKCLQEEENQELVIQIWEGLGTFDEIYFEQAFLHYQFNLTGKVDIITITNGVCKVWDIKTTKVLDEAPRAKLASPFGDIPKGKLSIARLQCSMYSAMLKWNGNDICDEVGVIHIEPYTKELLNIYHLPIIEILEI